MFWVSVPPKPSCREWVVVVVLMVVMVIRMCVCVLVFFSSFISRFLGPPSLFLVCPLGSELPSHTSITTRQSLESLERPTGNASADVASTISAPASSNRNNRVRPLQTICEGNKMVFGLLSRFVFSSNFGSSIKKAPWWKLSVWPPLSRSVTTHNDSSFSICSSSLATSPFSPIIPPAGVDEVGPSECDCAHLRWKKTTGGGRRSIFWNIFCQIEHLFICTRELSKAHLFVQKPRKKQLFPPTHTHPLLGKDLFLSKQLISSETSPRKSLKSATCSSTRLGSLRFSMSTPSGFSNRSTARRSCATWGIKGKRPPPCRCFLGEPHIKCSKDLEICNVSDISVQRKMTKYHWLFSTSCAAPTVGSPTPAGLADRRTPGPADPSECCDPRLSPESSTQPVTCLELKTPRKQVGS